MNAPAANSERRAIFLQELGIGPVWVRRDGAVTAEAPPAVEHVAAAIVEEIVLVAAAPVARDLPASAQVKAASAWDDVPTPAFLADPVPASVPTSVSASLPIIATAVVTHIADDGIADMTWPELKTAVASCTRCHLCQTRTNAVFGVGDEKARWLFVGEGPGRNEDKQGEPFVGPAGKLLDNMLLAMALKRGENTFIANVVKCRPIDSDGKDRAPTAEESAACKPYLERQIALLKPVTIVALGKVAALTLLGGDPKTSVAALREQLHHYGNVPVVATYHPAYLLRKPVDKAKSWRDLCMAADAYANFGDLAV
ncbi:uracil-DNA glycosylase [Actimicrobium antarcticum]